MPREERRCEAGDKRTGERTGFHEYTERGYFLGGGRRGSRDTRRLAPHLSSERVTFYITAHRIDSRRTISHRIAAQQHSVSEHNLPYCMQQYVRAQNAVPHHIIITAQHTSHYIYTSHQHRTTAHYTNITTHPKNPTPRNISPTATATSRNICQHRKSPMYSTLRNKLYKA